MRGTCHTSCFAGEGPCPRTVAFALQVLSSGLDVTSYGLPWTISCTWLMLQIVCRPIVPKDGGLIVTFNFQVALVPWTAMTTICCRRHLFWMCCVRGHTVVKDIDLVVASNSHMAQHDSLEVQQDVETYQVHHYLKLSRDTDQCMDTCGEGVGVSHLYM